MGFIDKFLQKISTKDPEKVAKGDTVLDGWYMLGKEEIIEDAQQDKKADTAGDLPEVSKNAEKE